MSDTSPNEHASALDDQACEQRLREYIASQHQMRKSNNGIVTGADLCDILESLGLPFEESEVKPLVPDWNDVSAEATAEAVTTVRITHNAELSHMMQKLDDNTIRLSLCEYLAYKLPFATKDPAWQYRTIEFSLNLAPRQVLFISTGVVLFVSGIAILLLMSLLWLNQADTRQRTHMENFLILIKSFAESFEQRYIDVHASTLTDEADSLATLVTRQHTLTVEQRMTDLISDAALIAGVINAVGGSAVSSLIEPQIATLMAISDVFRGAASSAVVGPLSDIVNTVTAVNDAVLADLPGGWETIIVARPSSNISARPSQIVVSSSSIVNCPYGPCDYDGLQCVSSAYSGAPTAAVGTVVTLLNTQDLTHGPATALYTRINSVTDGSGRLFDIVLCSILPGATLDSYRLDAMVGAVASINAELKEPILTRREVLLAHWTDASSSTVSWLSPFFRIPAVCFTLTPQTCTGLDSQVQQSLLSQSPLAGTVNGYSGEHLISAVAPTNVSNVAIVVDQLWEGLLESSRQDVIAVFDRINQKTSAPVELAIGRYDRATGVVLPQVTAFRFGDQCVGGVCERFSAGSTATEAALSTGTAGAVIQPNYQPAATVAAYSYVAEELNLAVVVERRIEEIRTAAVKALVSIFDAANREYSGSLEVALVHYRGQPLSKVFDPRNSCDSIRECVTRSGIGAVYRSDCSHCSMLNIDAAAAQLLESLTALKYQADCSKQRNCTSAALAHDSGLWRDAINRADVGTVTVKTTDYRGVDVLASYSYIANLSIVAIAKMDISEQTSPILTRIGIAAAVAFVIVVTGLALLIFFSRQVLDRIELEWLTYKDQIDAEKTKFDAMVQDVLPAQVSEDLKKSQKMAMSLPNMSFVFLDVVGMSDRTKNWSPELVCRYVTYIFTVVDTVCTTYSLNKVRVFGDTYFAVGGLGESTTEEHCVYRTACFGSVVVQLLGQRFAHFPDRVPLIKETFEDYVGKNGPVFPDVTENPTDVGHIIMPPMRVGMHFGIGTFCIIETGRTPAYEVFGPGVALASRMQSTSLGNRIHMSGAMKEMLERLDKDRLFDFDAMRKTVVKGQGTITSYFVRSASVIVPQAILDTLGIEHSNRRVFYDDATGAPVAPPAAGGH